MPSQEEADALGHMDVIQPERAGLTPNIEFVADREDPEDLAGHWVTDGDGTEILGFDELALILGEGPGPCREARIERRSLWAVENLE